MIGLSELIDRKASNYPNLTAYQNLLQFQNPSISDSKSLNCQIRLLSKPRLKYRQHVTCWQLFFKPSCLKSEEENLTFAAIDCAQQICKQLLNFRGVWSGLALHLWRRLHLIDSHGPQTIGSLIRINRRQGTGVGVKGWLSRQGTRRRWKTNIPSPLVTSYSRLFPFILNVFSLLNKESRGLQFFKSRRYRVRLKVSLWIFIATETDYIFHFIYWVLNFLSALNYWSFSVN